VAASLAPLAGAGTPTSNCCTVGALDSSRSAATAANRAKPYSRFRTNDPHAGIARHLTQGSSEAELRRIPFAERPMQPTHTDRCPCIRLDLVFNQGFNSPRTPRACDRTRSVSGAWALGPQAGIRRHRSWKGPLHRTRRGSRVLPVRPRRQRRCGGGRRRCPLRPALVSASSLMAGCAISWNCSSGWSIRCVGMPRGRLRYASSAWPQLNLRR
jgi:hypothetical protein